MMESGLESPFILADWQEWDILRPLFGWKYKTDNSRRFRIALTYIPRKNGKSPLAAGIGNYLMVGDGEFGAQVYTAATKKIRLGSYGTMQRR